AVVREQKRVSLALRVNTGSCPVEETNNRHTGRLAHDLGVDDAALGFGQDLGLDAATRARVDSIFAHRRVQIDSFWKGPGKALRAIMDSTREDVRSVLTPEQRARFDRRHMERRPQHPEDVGPPMPHP
ncbi:MAG: hypothetical protein JJD97_14365, partial [Gemmatimonadaceae bacterium]|nr:hypothetical protein [Gemmatimonadaceae bacterium]